MNTQNLIIYKFNTLYLILEELDLDLNFKIILVDNESDLKKKVNNLNCYLIITNKKYSGLNNQFVFNNPQTNILKLVEKINIEFLKIQFSNQSELKINNYIIDLNSREMIINNTKLKLTEKEIKTITYLSNTNNPVSIKELERRVWSYQSGIETHTVETHIYRLRKKILSTFNDNEFIISKKNGYQIN